jgi:malate dehydrogenase (oxaloacetate-decarboxylating)
MKATRVTDGMFLAAGHALANTVSDDRLKEGALYPSVRKFRQIARHVAIAVAHQAGKDGVAEEVPEEEAAERVDAQIWEPEYLPYRAV